MRFISSDISSQLPLLSSCPILPATRIFTEVSAWQEVAPSEQRHGIEGEAAAGAGLPRLKRSLGQVHILHLSRNNRLQDPSSLAGRKAEKVGLTDQGDPSKCWYAPGLRDSGRCALSGEEWPGSGAGFTGDSSSPWGPRRQGPW